MSSQLQHKLQQFEATPSKDVWHAIEGRLDDTDQSLQDKLYDFKAVPPAKTWNEIAASLDTAVDAPATTPGFTQGKWFRFSAAAVILTIMALSVLTYVSNQPQKSIAQQPAIHQQQTLPAIDMSSETISEKNTSTGIDNTTPVKEESIRLSKSSSAAPSASATVKHYKVVAKEDGKLVRLSQKAYAVFDCAVKSAAIKSERCKENIHTMQEKMATSLIAPTTDFAGLIDMIKTLEENE